MGKRKSRCKGPEVGISLGRLEQQQRGQSGPRALKGSKGWRQAGGLRDPGRAGSQPQAWSYGPLSDETGCMKGGGALSIAGGRLTSGGG